MCIYIYIRGARCLGWTWHEHLHWISEALLAESEFKSNLYHLGVSPRFASERILYFILFPDCSSRLLLSSSAWDLTKQSQWLIYLVVDTLAAESFAPCYSCRCCCSCSSSSSSSSSSFSSRCCRCGPRCCCRHSYLSSLSSMLSLLSLWLSPLSVGLSLSLMLPTSLLSLLLLSLLLPLSLLLLLLFLCFCARQKLRPNAWLLGARQDSDKLFEMICFAKKRWLLAVFEAFRSKKHVC